MDTLRLGIISGNALSKLAIASMLALQAVPAAAQLTVADMAGRWRITSSGFTGCGQVSMLMDVTIAPDGTSTNGTLTQHGQCGHFTLTGQAFRIESLAPDGSGTATMGCGPSCGWGLTIQLSRDRQVFNLVDVDPANPGNYIAGVAVKQR